MLLAKFPDFIRIIKKYNSDILNIDLDNIKNNLIRIDTTDYLFNNLSNNGNKGGNSLILKLYRVDDLSDKSSFDDVEPVKIIKILKFSFEKKAFKGNLKPSFLPVHKRFINEIAALIKCNNLTINNNNVIKIFDNGECVIENKIYLFYTMEVAKYDLKSYIEEHHEILEFENKIQICLELLDGVNQLDRAIYFHRDIKPDNIFRVGDIWKLADLGLVEGEDLEYKEFKEAGKFIGPRGWASPEVMNKYLSEGYGFKYTYDCKIDHQSDIFQLGKVFWYIFQYNAPIGNINYSDFKRDNSRVFWILRKMLHHNKQRRYTNVEDIIPLFQQISMDCIRA